MLTVDVAFRVSKRWGVPVRAEFACPDARTIVMTILDGEGAGSVVETHATALGTDDQGCGSTTWPTPNGAGCCATVAKPTAPELPSAGLTPGWLCVWHLLSSTSASRTTG